MSGIQRIRRQGDSAPAIPSLLALFNFCDGITPADLASPVSLGKTATLRLMSDGKPTDEIMNHLKRIFGRNEFDAATAGAKLNRPRSSLSDVLRAGAKHGLLTQHVTKPLGTIYYRIAS